MKRTILIFVLAICPFLTEARGQSNREVRVNYVLTNIGVKRDVQAKLRPLLEAYLADKKKANQAYDGLKKKLELKIKGGTISNEQADQLLALKWVADEKELAVKKAYEKKFKTVLTSKKTYQCFDLLNDKKSKMLGKSKSGDSDDE